MYSHIFTLLVPFFYILALNSSINIWGNCLEIPLRKHSDNEFINIGYNIEIWKLAIKWETTIMKKSIYYDNDLILLILYNIR